MFYIRFLYRPILAELPVLEITGVLVVEIFSTYINES